MRRLGRAVALLTAVALGAAPLVGQQRGASDPVRRFLDSLRLDPNGLTLSASDARSGSRTVATGEHITGDVIAWHGDLDVSGAVDGNAVAIGGDVRVHPGGVVGKDALSVGGTVHADGTVTGEMRTLSALSVGPLLRPHLTPAQATRRSLSLAVGWYLVLAVIGLGVVLFARGNLETVAETVRDDYTRAFLVGLVGQLALGPVLLLSIVALCITLIGILLIPFAIVAYVLAAAGALALGFLAMSLVTGEAAMRARGGAVEGERAPVLQHLLIGLSLFLVLWIVAGGLTWAGFLGVFVRMVVTAVTWVAVTVGFGATVLSRGGTRLTGHGEPLRASTTEEYAWQTPTPVSGVAAARRPTPPPRSSEP